MDQPNNNKNKSKGETIVVVNCQLILILLPFFLSLCLGTNDDESIGFTTALCRFRHYHLVAVAVFGGGSIVVFAAEGIAAVAVAAISSNYGSDGEYVSKAQTQTTPLGIAGWRLEFYQLGLIGGNDEQQQVAFSAIGTDSGGTWFATQFFYSQNFYDSTMIGTTTGLYNFVVLWMDTHLKLTQDGKQQQVSASSIIDNFKKLLGCIKSVITYLADLVSVMRSMINFGDNWYFFINEISRYALCTRRSFSTYEICREFLISCLT